MKPQTLNRLVLLLFLSVLLFAAAFFPFDRMPSTCPMYNLTGIPCPFCKMTTSWTMVLHGKFSAGLKTNPYGVLFLIAALLAIAYLIFALLARRPYRNFAACLGRHRLLVILFLLGWLANWAYVICRRQL